MRSFGSILWGNGTASDADAVVPDTIADLELDQFFEFVGWANHEAVCCAPLSDLDAVRYRQQVFDDLGDDSVRGIFDTFVAGMSSVREHVRRGQKLPNPLQRDRWQLDAEAVYCRTILNLHTALHALPIRSVGLGWWRKRLAEYVEESEFRALVADSARARAALDSVRYTVQVKGRQLVVDRFADQPDYSELIATAFARFGADDEVGGSRLPPPWPDMNEVEEQVLALVVAQQPDAFRELDAHARRHRNFIDASVDRFDRELHFYLDYLRVVRKFQEQDLSFSIPEVTDGFQGVFAEGAYDAALAPKVIQAAGNVVRNDLRLSGRERVFVVTGPNQGGKSTFARTLGQLMYLASLGCPVPATSARLPLPDNIFTHFVREDDVDDADGGLARELRRLHEILTGISDRSLVVLNESLSTTSVGDATRLGAEVVRRIIESGAVAVYVTFLDELAELGPEIVSMVAGVEPDSDGARTYRIERRPPDGLAHAEVIARRHGLSYDEIRERIR